MLDQCWADFRVGLAEVVHFAEAAECASTETFAGSFLNEQQSYVRAAIVLLASHLEAFLRAIPDEYIDAIVGGVTMPMRPGVERYVTMRAADAIASEIELVADGFDAARRRKFYETVIRAGRWIRTPARVKEATRPELIGFYKQRNVESINKYMESFSGVDRGFFDWIASKGMDKSRFATVLKGLINARNQIAHGNAALSLSVKDLRDYIAVVTVMVRLVRRYIY